MGKAVTYLTVLMVMIQMPVLLPAAEKSAVVAELAAGEEKLPDTDKDGMPDEVELRFGMDVKNPSDALSDPDGDGFASLFEIEHGFDPSDPLSHPPLWWRLQVKKLVRVDFPVQFAALKKCGSRNAGEWLLTVEFAGKGDSGSVKKDVQIGEILTIGKKRFRITGVKSDENALEMVLTQIVSAKKKPVVIELKLGEKFFDWCPVLVDTGDSERREYVVHAGENIVLGMFAAYKADGKIVLDAAGRRKQIRSYTLLSVGADDFVVSATDGAKENGKLVKFEITPEGMVPVDRQVRR